MEHEFYLSIQLGIIIIPIDEFIFFRGVGIPPSRKIHEIPSRDILVAPDDW